MGRRLLFLIAVLIARASVVAAGLPDASLATAVSFDPPIEASIKLADKSALEGRLSGFDVEGVHLTTNRGKKLFIPLKQVRTLSSRSGFQFNADTDKVLLVIQQARAKQAAPAESPPAVVAEPLPTPDRDESNWSTLVAASREEHAATKGTDPSAKPGQNPKQNREFLCPKCGHSVKADGTVVSQFEFCPKCGAAQSNNAFSTGAEATWPVSGESSAGRARESENVVSGSSDSIPFARTHMGRSIFFVLATAVFYIIFKWLFPDRE